MFQKTVKETWIGLNEKDLHQDENFQISNFGRIKSFKVYKNEGKIIKGSWICGYNCIISRLKSGKSKTFYVHKLVAQFFVKKENKNQNTVIHIDFIKANNDFRNLKWADYDDLKNHRHNDPNYDKKKIRNAKLTEDDVIRIKTILKTSTLKPYRIAHQFGISQTQLARISNGQNWAHINID